MAFKFRIYSGMQSDSLVYKDCSCDRFYDFKDHELKKSNIINIKIINNIFLFIKFINNNIVLYE